MANKAQTLVGKIEEAVRKVVHRTGNTVINYSLAGWELGLHLEFPHEVENIHPVSVYRAWEILREKGYVIESETGETLTLSIKVDSNQLVRYEEYIALKKATDVLMIKMADVAGSENPSGAATWGYGDYFDFNFRTKPEDIALIEGNVKKVVEEKLVSNGLKYMSEYMKVSTEFKGSYFFVKFTFSSGKLHVVDYDTFARVAKAIHGYMEVKSEIKADFSTKIISVPDSLLELNEEQLSVATHHVEKIAKELDTKVLQADIDNYKPIRVFIDKAVCGTVAKEVMRRPESRGYDVEYVVKAEDSRWAINEIQLNSIPVHMLEEVKELRATEYWIFGFEDPKVDLTQELEGEPYSYMWGEIDENLLTQQVKNGRRVVFMSPRVIPIGLENLPRITGKSVWVVQDGCLIEHTRNSRLPVTIFRNAEEESHRILTLHPLTEDEQALLLGSDLLPHRFNASQIFTLTPEQQELVGKTKSWEAASDMWESLDRTNLSVLVFKYDEISPRQFEWWTSFTKRGITVIVIHKDGSRERLI